MIQLHGRLAGLRWFKKRGPAASSTEAEYVPLAEFIR